MPALINLMAARGFFGGSAPAVTPGPTNLIPLMLDGSHTYNGAAPVTVNLVGETYRSSIAAGDSALTTHFNADRGRLDYLSVTGDCVIDFINIGLISGATNEDYQFCGVAVYNTSSPPTFGPDYMFGVIGQRGPTGNTLEFKITINDVSNQNDTGPNTFPTGRGDIRVIRSGSSITMYYRQPGQTDDDWILVPHSSLSNYPVTFDATVRVGIVTYGAYYIEAFSAGCDAVYVNSGSYA